MNKKIGKFYTPFQAQTYEIQRKNPIWEAEEVVYEKVIQRVHNEYSEKNLSILDLPVGTGRWIPFANSYCSRYVGIDISENMLSEARKKISRMGNVDGSKYSLYNSSYAAVAELNLGKFDLVVSTRFLPHFHIAEIQDILNVLTSHCNGYCLVMVRVAENEFDRFLEKLSFVISSPYRAYLRMRKTGRLSYTKKRTDYYKVINSVGLNIVEEHLIYDYGRSTFEYWLLRK